MSTFFEKISSYNIFNFLLPGIIYVLIVDNVTSFSLVQSDIVIGLFLYYFVGLVISRIGSIIIEPLFIKIKFMKYSSYKDFIEASRADDKLELLSEINNMYRTFSSLFILCLFTILYDNISIQIKINREISIGILLFGLLLVFLLSYKKQTEYIYKRIHVNTKKEAK